MLRQLPRAGSGSPRCPRRARGVRRGEPQRRRGASTRPTTPAPTVDRRRRLVARLHLGRHAQPDRHRQRQRRSRDHQRCPAVMLNVSATDPAAGERRRPDALQQRRQGVLRLPAVPPRPLRGPCRPAKEPRRSTRSSGTPTATSRPWLATIIKLKVPDTIAAEVDPAGSEVHRPRPVKVAHQGEGQGPSEAPPGQPRSPRGPLPQGQGRLEEGQGQGQLHRRQAS